MVEIDLLNDFSNYDRALIQLPVEELTSLSDEFNAHHHLFGFQIDNVRNQYEHLLFLLQNSIDRYGEKNAYSYLHARIFANYSRWIDHINAQRWCCQRQIRNGFLTDNYSEKSKRQDLILWLLIWGEAANCRHLPEFLCFIFYKMSSLRADIINGRKPAIDRSGTEWFRLHVIDPAYYIVSSMMLYYRNNGTLKDHSKRPNYDDVNEYFWRREWLQTNVEFHNEDSSKWWGANYLKVIDIDSVTQKPLSTQKEGSTRDKSRKDTKRVQMKTFVEKRSYLNLLRSFGRIAELHLFALHILMGFAYKNYYSEVKNQQIGYTPVYSAVITLAALSVIAEVLEAYFYWGIIIPMGYFFNMIIRLTFHCGVLGLLIYLQFATSIPFQWIALGYLVIKILLDFISVSSHRWIRKWHLGEDKNFESDVRSQHFGILLLQTIYWIFLFSLKCVYSYYTYIRPLVIITDDILSVPGWAGKRGIAHNNNNKNSNYLLVVLMWLPTVIIYVIDTQIFFSLGIVVIGWFLGIKEGVSNIRSWGDIQNRFSLAWRNGARKLFPLDKQMTVRVDNIRAVKGKNFTLPALINPPWKPISVLWHEIVQEMRAGDSISYHDQQLLDFGQFYYIDKLGNGRTSFFLPAFVTAGQVGIFIDRIGSLQSQLPSRGDDNDRIQLLKGITQFLSNHETIRVALDELYVATTLFLKEMIREAHFDISDGNKFLEFTSKQKQPHSFVTETVRLITACAGECISLCFDKGVSVLKRPLGADVYEDKHDTNQVASQDVNVKPFSQAVRNLYRVWARMHISEDESLHSDVCTIEVGKLDDAQNEGLHTLLRVMHHLLSVPAVDARPQNPQVTDRLMFFLSSLSSEMPDRQNTIRQQYSWTVLTPYADELVIYSNNDLSKPNQDGVTAEFYLQSTHKKEWRNFLERMMHDPKGMDPKYRQAQKREWCSYRGQTLLRTVRGMMFYEKATKLLALLEMTRGSSWTDEQEQEASLIAQRKFQYVVSCQKYGQFLHSRQRRENGELTIKSQLPEAVKLERKRHLDEAAKADDIEYIMRKFPHIRIAYVDEKLHFNEKSNNHEKVYYSVLVKSVTDKLLHQRQRSQLMEERKENYLNVHSTQQQGLQINNELYNPSRNGSFNDEIPVQQDLSYDEEEIAITNANIYIKPRVQRIPTIAGILEIYRIRLPGTILVGEGKPENQNQALIFTRGEIVQAIDMNQDNYFEEAIKMRNLLEEFDPIRRNVSKQEPRDEVKRPNPIRKHENGVLKYSMVGFREHIFTANLTSVGTYMSLMEATFVSITLRTFAFLGIRMHYGHPDLLDKLFFMTRGGISKASKMIHVSEDIFAGFKSTLRHGLIAHKEYIQCGKGRDLGFTQLFLFEAKLAAGAGEQALSREAYRLGRYLELPRLLSFFYGSIGFYATTSLMVISVFTLLFARMMMALTHVDEELSNFHNAYGVAINLLHSTSVLQLGFLLVFPMLAEIALEKTLIKSLATMAWMILTGSPLFFFFHMQTKAFFFNNSIMYGGAKYRPTGRGFALSRESFTRIYRQFARTHLYPASKLLFMLVTYAVFDNTSTYFEDTWAAWFLFASWIFAPVWFNPLAFDHDKVISDFGEWRKWLSRVSSNEETSWQAWWQVENDYLNRCPRSTKTWLAIFNFFIPAVIILAAVSSLEADNINRVLFMIIAFSLSVGVVLFGLLFLHYFRPEGDVWRYMKFFFSVIFLAAFFFILFFDFGGYQIMDPRYRGTNVSVFILSIVLTFNAVCKILVLCGAGPFKFSFVLNWFRYCDALIGLIFYLPWLFLSFIDFTAVQTRLLYNRAFFKGLRVKELLKGKNPVRMPKRYQPLTSRRSAMVPSMSSEALDRYGYDRPSPVNGSSTPQGNDGRDIFSVSHRGSVNGLQSPPSIWTDPNRLDNRFPVMQETTTWSSKGKWRIDEQQQSIDQSDATSDNSDMSIKSYDPSPVRNITHLVDRKEDELNQTFSSNNDIDSSETSRRHNLRVVVTRANLNNTAQHGPSPTNVNTSNSEESTINAISSPVEQENKNESQKDK